LLPIVADPEKYDAPRLTIHEKKIYTDLISILNDQLTLHEKFIVEQEYYKNVRKNRPSYILESSIELVLLLYYCILSELSENEVNIRGISPNLSMSVNLMASQKLNYELSKSGFKHVGELFKHRQPTYISLINEFLGLENNSTKRMFKSEWLAENFDHIIMAYPLCKYEIGDFYLPNSNASAQLIFWKYFSNLLINFFNLLSEYIENIKSNSQK
jgi:hypothetical protein